MALSLSQSIIVSLADFWSRKVRSLITIFGIILGIMSIIVVLALVNGVKEMSMEWMMESGGLSKINVYSNWDYEDRKIDKSLKLSQVNYIREVCPEAKAINPETNIWTILQYGSKKEQRGIWGVYPDYQIAENWTVQEGRFITDTDINQKSNVIVLGTNVKKALFGNSEAIGELVNINGKKFLVVGVMKHRYMKNRWAGEGQSDNAMDWKNWNSFVPLSTMLIKLKSDDRIWSLGITASSPEASIELKKKIENIILNFTHGKPLMKVTSAYEESNQTDDNMKMMTMIFFLVAAISLLVGGIVIMNIMLATIQERTREIGVRLSVGARRFDIFMQFLIQTVIITTIGGVLGVIGGLSILDLVGNFLQMKAVASEGMVLTAILVSVGIGLIFGIFPAIRASNLDPVEALRYE
ncbi:MAG: ABC transporter permease [Candidatus Cloacimonetes bacterium]|nr:ABC transporter permease [Candidatus Cloacimonadota bacterium]